MKKLTTELQQKNKKGVANIILLIGIMFILSGASLGFSNLDLYAGKAFLLCGFGTFLTFVSNYMKNGYIKFFN